VLVAVSVSLFWIMHGTITNCLSHSFCLGTVTGVSQYIKGCPEFDLPPLNADLHTVAVEPQEQMLITAAKGGEKRGEQGPHKIQGMGAGLVPDVLQLEYIDEVVAVHSDDAMATCKELWMMGIPTGVSSGAIVNASLKVCEQHPNKTAVCIIPSFGERYFTHPMFESIKDQATNMTKQPLPEPYDNTDFGFATPRG
jgi:cysteine synthase A